MRETRLRFAVGELPSLGDLAMDWAGFVFEIIGISLFGDEVYAKPLPNFCTDGEWHHQIGKEPRWIKLDSLIPMVNPNTALTRNIPSSKHKKEIIYEKQVSIE